MRISLLIVTTEVNTARMDQITRSKDVRRAATAIDSAVNAEMLGAMSGGEVLTAEGMVPGGGARRESGVRVGSGECGD